MRKKNNIHKRVLTIKEKKLRKIHYRILIGLMIAFVIHHIFFDGKLIGHDDRYSIYVFCLPTLAGIIILGIYRKDLLLKGYLSFKDINGKIFFIGFYLLQGILFSYLSFGFTTHVIWNYLNKKEAEKNPVEIKRCNVTRFWAGKGASIDFEFKEEQQSFGVRREVMRKYEDENPKNYVLKIEARKGMWNYYVVENWTIKKKG